MISQRVLCVLARDRQCLLLHRRRSPNAGMWNGIGGKIEPGEDPFAACIREVHEETGLAITDPKLRVLLVITTRDTSELWIIYAFYAPAPAGDLAASEEGDLRWVDVDEVLSLRTPADLPVILPRILHGEDVTVVRFGYEAEWGEARRIEILGA